MPQAAGSANRNKARRWLVRGAAVACSLVLALLVVAGADRVLDPLPEGYGAVREDQVFRDCDVCPELLPIQPGSFTMGSEWVWRRRYVRPAAVPRHTVVLQRPFAVGRFEVTFDEWAACLEGGGCGGHIPDDQGWGRGRRPVVDVSWNDAQLYLDWLTRRTGASYRLLSEAEWEYVARGGATTPYPWGKYPSYEFANFGQEECCIGHEQGRDRFLHTAPVGEFPPNRFGVYDVAGNVYEWVQDCFRYRYDDAPGDGSAQIRDGCEHRGIRGGAWYSDPGRVRASYRAFQTPDRRDRVIGFRVARTL